MEPLVPAITKVDSLDVEDISETEWKEFANNMQVYDHKRFQRWAKSCNPKILRQYFSPSMATRNLHQAAKHGKHDVIKVLFAMKKIDINMVDEEKNTALHYAAWEGHLDIVNILLEQRNINASLRNENGDTALFNASKKGHFLIVGKLLGAPTVDVNNANESGKTALYVAASKGHEKIVDLLVKAPKVDVNIANDSGKTALYVAASKGHEKIVDLLLNAPNVEVTSGDHSCTPLHKAAKHGHATIVEMILQRSKVDVNVLNDGAKQSPLYLATMGSHENVVDLLLKQPNVKPSLGDVRGNTPLHVAAEAGNEVIFEKLLQAPEVDVNSANEAKMTALHYAAKNKHVNLVKKLLADPNANPCVKGDRRDDTPLHTAARVGAVDIVQVLLRTGKVKVNVTNSYNYTAIHCATHEGHLNVIDELLNAPDVDPCMRDLDDDTPLHLAARYGHKNIVQRLMGSSYEDLNIVNKTNQTPLHRAAEHGHIDVVDLFLEDQNVDPSIADHNGDTPFHIAIKGRHEDIALKLVTRVVPIHPNKDNMAALQLCIKEGLANVVDTLLKQPSMNANAKDVYGDFPIHHAAKKGNTSIFHKILTAPKVDVNSVNDHQDTALHVVVREGHGDLVDMLLQAPNLKISLQNRDGNSALHMAAKYNQEEIIEKLLKADGVEVNAKGERGASALYLAAKEGNELVVEKLLKVQDIQANLANKWGIPPLCVAAYKGHDIIVKRLLEHGVDVNATDPFLNYTALFSAIKHGHAKVVNVLLNESNVDPNIRYLAEVHPLHIAAEDGHKVIVEKLLATGKVDVNVVSHGKTALQVAARNGREQVVKVLVATPSIDVYIKDNSGETALFYAARGDNKTILKDIYNASKVYVGSEEHNVHTRLNINEVNHEGESIIHLAARGNFLNVIDFLLEVLRDDAKSVDGNLKTSSPKNRENVDKKFIGKSALEIAIEESNYAIIEKLTKFNDISFTKEGDDGMTLLQQIFDKRQSDKRQWEAFKILRRTSEVKDYIDQLYKDRQASVDAANAILVGAALIASVTFASWLQPPLGYSTYYHEQFLDTAPAPLVSYPQYASFDHHPILRAFWVFNSLSFFCAIATVISGARSVLPAQKLFITQEVLNLRRNLLITSILLGFSMFFVLLAFATAGVAVLPPVKKFRENIFSTIGIGGSLCVVFLFLLGKNIYELLSDIKNSKKKKNGIFGRWPFNSWHMLNTCIKSKNDNDDVST